MTRLLTWFMNAKERHRFLLILLLFSLALILRTLSSGLEYLPILDDSIQYINYPKAPDYAALIRNEGLFASRPLAAIMDLFVVGQMGAVLILPALIFAVMHAVSGVLFLRLFDKIYDTGIAFAILYALLPLGTEGTYWLSAASRIVPGLFFTAIAANLLEDYIDDGKLWRVISFPIAALLSYGFYEQILVLSFALSGLQFLRRVRSDRRAWAAALVFPMLALYFLFTGMQAADGALGDRISFIVPNAWYVKVFLPDLIRQIGAAFVKGGARTLFIGFVRGLGICFGSVGGVICLIASLGIGAAICFAMPNKLKNKLAMPRIGVWIWGILLFAAPLAPYFLIENPWFSLRATVPSFIGAGLLIDALLRLILRRERIYAIVCAVLASVCLIASISEIHDYHEIGKYDNAIADAILASADEMSGRVGILCLEEVPFDDQNYSYHEHIQSASASDWALYGKLVAVNDDELDFTPVPLATEGFSFYREWNKGIKRISGFDQLWLWDHETRSLTPMVMIQKDSGEHDFEITYADGTPWGSVFEEGDFGYIEIYE